MLWCNKYLTLHYIVFMIFIKKVATLAAYKIAHNLILTLTYKWLSNDAPQYLSDLLGVNQPLHNLRSTAPVHIHVYEYQTLPLNPPRIKFFSMLTPLVEILPASNRNLPTIQSFKTAIKPYHFKQCLISLPKEL